MNKEQERAIVERLLSSIRDAPSGTLVPGEAPDFTMRAGDAQIGIEVTELYEQRGEGNEAAAEFHQVNVVIKQAQELAHRRGVPAAFVTVHFAVRAISKRRTSGLAAELVDIVAAAMPSAGESRTIQQTYTQPPALPAELDDIEIMRLEDGLPHSWTQIDAGFARNDLLSHLQECIDGKSKKYPGYLERCDECWLVIYCSDLPGVAFFAPDDSLAAQRFVGPFPRAFYFGGFSGQPIELLIAAEIA